jgi:hypothetical protein
MVASQTHNPRMLPRILLPLHSTAAAVTAGRRMVQHLSVSLLHLLEGVRGVERRDRDISAVDLASSSLVCQSIKRMHLVSYNLQSLVVRINPPHRIITPSLLLARRPGADPARPEARAGSVGRRGVVGEA